jgi:hypothetical protein
LTPKKLKYKWRQTFLTGSSVKLRFKQTVREESDFVEVAKTGEIEPGKMKSVDVKGVDV